VTGQATRGRGAARRPQPRPEDGRHPQILARLAFSSATGEAAEQHFPWLGHGHLVAYYLVVVPLAPAAAGEAAAGVLVRAVEALHHAAAQVSKVRGTSIRDVGRPLLPRELLACADADGRHGRLQAGMPQVHGAVVAGGGQDLAGGE
jgi:hypothetical protein